MNDYKLSEVKAICQQRHDDKLYCPGCPIREDCEKYFDCAPLEIEINEDEP